MCVHTSDVCTHQRCIYLYIYMCTHQKCIYLYMYIWIDLYIYIWIYLYICTSDEYLFDVCAHTCVHTSDVCTHEIDMLRQHSEDMAQRHPVSGVWKTGGCLCLVSASKSNSRVLMHPPVLTQTQDKDTLCLVSASKRHPVSCVKKTSVSCVCVHTSDDVCIFCNRFLHHASYHVTCNSQPASRCTIWKHCIKIFFFFSRMTSASS